MAGPIVAHVDAELGFSGGEAQVFLLMEGLRQRGWEGVLVCRPRSACAARGRERGFEVRTAEMRNDLDLPGMLAVARALEASGAQLVHLHTARAHWLGGLAAHKLGLPALVTRRMDRPLRRGPRTTLLYGTLVRHVVAISRNVEAHLRAAGLPAERITRIESAVDPAALVARRAREAVRAELGAGPLEPVLLALGGLVPRKGHDLTLEALAELSADGLRPTLWLAGEGPEREALLARARAAGVAEQVRFLGQRADVPDLLAAADALVMPSRAEGLGVAALEALAAGLPVVAARVGGLAQSIQHERNGLLVEPDDPAALAEALGRLLRDDRLRARLAEAGPERIAEGYLAASMVERYEELYRSLLAAAGRPLAVPPG